MNKTLIFFTSDFPYGINETFIENEFPLLEQAFDKIIFVTNNIIDNNIRINKSNNVHIIRQPYSCNSITAVFSLFSKDFYIEVFTYIKRKKKLPSKAVYNTIAQSLNKEKQISKLLKQKLLSIVSKNEKIIFYSYWMNDMALVISDLKKHFPYSKCITRAHRWDLYEEVNLLKYLPFRNKIIKNTNTVYAIANDGKNYLLNNYKTFNNIILSQLGTINNNKFSEFNDKKIFNLVSCSRAIEVKRIDLIINGISNLKIPFYWNHFGGGKLEQECKQTANDLLNKNQYNFHGNVDNQEILRFYKNNNITALINTSSTEGLPVSMMEAMSFGIPVIGTDVGGVSEIVEHKINGFLLPSNPTPQEVANAIEYIYNLPDKKYLQMRKNAYNTWDTKFNAEKNYKAFVDEILKL